jgi:hypothetical protein
MKKLLTIILLGALMAGTMAQERQEQVRKIGSFDKVKATKGINVTLIEGSTEQAEIHIENGSLNDVITELKNKELTIKMKTKIYKGVAVQVYLTYVKLREITAGSGGEINAENTIITDKLKIDAGTESVIILDVDVNALEASVSAGRIELAGEVHSQVASAKTGGKYLAYELSSEEAIIRSNTGARAEVTVTEKLNATAGSGATVNYKGDPEKIEQKVSMGGKVNAAD